MQSSHSSMLSYGTSLQAIGQTMRGIRAFITLLFDESGSLEPVWELSQSLVDSPAAHQAIALMKATPEAATLLAERYTPRLCLKEVWGKLQNHSKTKH